MWWRVKPLQHPVRVELSVFDATEGEDRHYERLRITTSQFCGRILFHHLYQCIVPLTTLNPTSEPVNQLKYPREASSGQESECNSIVSDRGCSQGMLLG